jgi:2Fe-2S ferredoxin
MPKLIVTTREGDVREVQGQSGFTVMEVIRDNGLADPFAICGGSCACATCHVYIDPAFTAVVGKAGEDENDLLEGSEHRKPESRLSCQIDFGPKLDGLKVTVAPEE